MIIMIPLLQLILFGYAINTNPRHLPTAVLLQEQSDLGRSILAALKNTNYFKVTAAAAHRGRARRAARLGHRCCSRSRFRRISSARCGAAMTRPCWSMADAHRSGCRPARRSARSARWCSPRSSTITRMPDAARLAVRIRTHIRYNPAGLTPAQHRAGTGRHHSHHDHADLHRALGDARDRARHHGKPARPCRSRRSRSCSARSFPI